MGLVARLTNTITLADLASKRWADAHPGEPVLVHGATKAVRSDRELPVGRGAHWATSRRGAVLVTPKRVVCGDWDVPVDEIVSAELLSFRSLLSGGQMLKLATRSGQHYQFGLQHDDRWDGPLPFPVKRGAVELGWSAFSIVVRVVLLVAVGWWIWAQFAGV